MKRMQTVVLLAALAVLLQGATGCNKLKARDKLNKGVQAYKAAKYEDAIERFKEAVALDPKLKNAKLYLATAYAQQVVEGLESEENLRYASLAIEQYTEVLKQDPSDINSMKGIAALYYKTKKFDLAKEYHRKVLAADPNDPETYYSIGVIDWSQTYVPRQEKRAALGLKPSEPLKDKKVCPEVRETNQAKVEEGIELLKKAIELRPDYEDAMAYLNLMYREKADIQCDDDASREQLLKLADEMVEKTMAVKKAKAEEAEKKPGGVHLEN
ncbi:MAG: tetratricopeptide repeat protein [Acidobacteria bacterium]|nr:tetratricopeptide repeat protein [Acidobacteriota bacterium]